VDEQTMTPAVLGAEPAGQPGGEVLPDWAPWTAPVALVCGLLLAGAGGLLVDIPAIALGVNVSAKHLPGGLVIADTIVQDAGFVLVAVLFARRGGRPVSAAMFGLRPPRTSLWGVIWRIAVMFLAVLAFAALWESFFHPGKDKLLEKLGSGDGATLLVLSAVLTCVVAPICEEFLFRGYFFTALRNWRGVWPAALITGLVFGGVHVGSAPLADVAPLAALGVGLCLLYRFTGSLYPCIAAHSLNNSVAFGSLEGWSTGQVLALMVGALLVIWLLALALISAGVISADTPVVGTGA
jgi:uncharacterized protein